jgi:flagellar hook-associated protein 3 FlgL
MRITANQIVRNMQNIINDRYADLADLQEQSATGKRLRKPSDQPQDVANDLKLKTNLAGLSQYNKNLDDGRGFMSTTDTAMSGMNDLLQRMRELAVESSTDTITSTERVYFNSEVEQLSRQLVALINTQFKGDYIFGGTQTKISPLELKSSKADTTDDYAKLNMAYYNAAGAAMPATVQLFNGFDHSPTTNIIPGSFDLKVGTTSYSEGTDYTIDYKNGTITILNPALAVDTTPGTVNYAPGQFDISFDYLAKGKDVFGATVSNQGTIERQVENGISMPINISADELMNNPAEGSDMLGTVIGLGDDLLKNDRDGISSAIDGIDGIMKTINSAQAKNGARINRFDATQSRNADQTANSTDLQSKLEDAEMASTITNYMNAQNVYDAALKSAAGMLQQSLVNFL